MTYTAAPQTEADIKFGYCTEFIIMLEKEYTEEAEQGFKGFLESIGGFYRSGFRR